MIQAFLVIGAILVVAILILIFRVQTMVDVMRGSTTKRVGTSNRINAILFPITLILGLGLFVWYSFESADQFLPEASSIHGKKIDQMFWLTMGILIFVFVLTHLLLFYFPYRYQFKENRTALFYPDNNKLEIIWTTIPAIVLALLVFTGWKVWTEVTDEAPEDRVELEIVGKQFNWIVRYPGKDGKLGAHNYKAIDATNELGLDMTDKANFDDFKPREIHLPVGKPVLFKIRARDVLHSVFAPYFRMKMDAVPGMPTRFWFTPTKTTAQMREELGDQSFEYEIACTEVCGRNHFAMRMLVVVEEEEEYEKWYAEQPSMLASAPEYYLEKVPANLRPIAELEVPIEKLEELKKAAADSSTAGVTPDVPAEGQEETPVRAQAAM
ncbi:cytochrome c oxidase subunit 2 [Catalinimonas alkaloidigena]|uniref:Cytochrome c oxidase subunit 2 n=1 Tax=Catalinimonas alkaloidigena TaxID=1075417 RepID=A0A1G9BJM0_9BACT|nr:cytochrome c oxidase subunit II transmembrane domain-containing protein [Catalinimonas alkaloidigena]SDK39055.1 cytochrome c oxidase subunit 2 [Catalinimonas alkaloidigena]